MLTCMSGSVGVEKYSRHNWFPMQLPPLYSTIFLLNGTPLLFRSQAAMYFRGNWAPFHLKGWILINLKQSWKLQATLPAISLIMGMWCNSGQWHMRGSVPRGLRERFSHPKQEAQRREILSSGFQHHWMRKYCSQPAHVKHTEKCTHQQKQSCHGRERKFLSFKIE